MYEFQTGSSELLDELLEEVDSGEFEYDETSDETDDELATGLLEATSDQELDYFLGKAMKGAKRFLRSKQGGLLKGALRGLARKALPAVGAAFGGPVGARIASTAGSMLGLELEGLTSDEAELEVAKRIIRVAKDTARAVARDMSAAADPKAAVSNALQQAVQKNLPGIVKSVAGSAPAGGFQSSGRWIRRGRRIVLLGA